MVERHQRILARLGEMGLVVAEAMAARVSSAADTDEAAKAAAGFHRVARAVRQTTALEARLSRDHAREARAADEARLEAERRARAEAVARRRQALAIPLRADIRDTYFGHQQADKLKELEERLDAQEALDAFEADDVEELLDRFRLDLRFHEARRGGRSVWTFCDDEDEAEDAPEGDGPEAEGAPADPEAAEDGDDEDEEPDLEIGAPGSRFFYAPAFNSS